MNARLPVSGWMTASRTRAVLDALSAAGGPDCARFVGGCVRNSLIGRPADDIDIATTLTPEAVTAALKAARLKAVPTGIEHGTVTAVSGGRPYEITTLRRDVETDGRRAVVAFTTDWDEDARRRDFTLNALYADAGGQVFDPVGSGVDDARAGRIIFVGDPGARIREDYLRILRFFRFMAWYGRGEADPAALAACSALKDGLDGLAAERVSKELLKLLAAEEPRTAVRLMDQAGVLARILPAPPDLERFAALVEIEAALFANADPVLRLAALLPADPDTATTLARRLRMSNAVRDRLADAVAPDAELAGGMSPRAVRRAVYRLGQGTFRDRVTLAWAASGGDSAQWRALLAQAEAWQRPSLPLTGEDAKVAGVPPGPLVGQVLRAVEAWWIEQDFPDDRPAVAKQLATVVQRLAP